MADDTMKSGGPAAPAKKKKAPAKKKASAKPKAPKMPDELREHGKLPPAEFLRRAAIFLAQIGVLALDREDLRQRMRQVRQGLGRR